jgi:peptidoglycan/xylan/chitin deacetylase (PgdA/CDA1 family)
MSSNEMQQPVLTVQVDADTQKNLLIFYGFETSPDHAENAVYELALPRFAQLFKELRLRATFFVIGEHLNKKPNRDVVRQLHKSGHEIANHTQTHPYNFSRLNPRQKRAEIEHAGEAIAGVTGERAVGFRAPGYDVDSEVLETLWDLGYTYDSSIMPSIFNLPLKLFHTLLSRGWSFTGYGSMALSLSPNCAHRLDAAANWRPSGGLWEIPVSCVPYLRLPFYSNFNLFTGDTVFRLSAALASGQPCNYIFHAIEMLDPREIDRRIHRHPNARLPLEDKIIRCRRFLQQLMKGRRVLLSREFADELEHSEARALDPSRSLRNSDSAGGRVNVVK